MDPYFGYGGHRFGSGIMCGPIRCPADTALYSYYCCNYGECCLYLGGWGIFLIVFLVVLLLLCCAGGIGGCIYAARRNSNSRNEP